MHESRPAVFIHLDCLIDPRQLAAALPDAIAATMKARHGGSLAVWQSAYRSITADWHSYWADLNLSEADSLAQWREGRWRIVRALFRLAGQSPPASDRIAYYLDELPRDQGRLCPVWTRMSLQALRRIAGVAACVILTPYQPSSLIWGTLDAVYMTHIPAAVIGPDELEQVGLEAIDGHWLAALAGSAPSNCTLVGPAAVDGLPHVTPPADLSTLPDLALPGR